MDVFPRKPVADLRRSTSNAIDESMFEKFADTDLWAGNGIRQMVLPKACP